MPKAKDRLAKGQPVLVVNPGGAAPDAVDILARLGVDIVFIDCERTAVGIESVAPMSRAAQARGASAIVRSHSSDPADWIRYWDRGIDGLVIPHVESAKQAQLVVETAQYACGDSVKDKLVIVQIESKQGVDQLDEIMTVSGIHVFLIGPYDLSHSMGFKGDIRVPELQRTVDTVAKKLRGAGHCFGLPCRRAEFHDWMQKGARFFYHPMEWLLLDSLSQLPKELK